MKIYGSKLALVLSICGIVFLFYYTFNKHLVGTKSNDLDVRNIFLLDSPLPAPTIPAQKAMSFDESLIHYSSNRVLFLSSVDMPYISMAINLYETSYKPLGIHNYLFLCSDNKAYNMLQGLDINSHIFLHNISDEANNWGSMEFKYKTQIKTRMMAYALRLDLFIVLIDVDIVLFKDPLPYLDCKDCDIQIQSDDIEANSGFYFVRPTHPSKILHEEALKTVIKSPKVDDQKALNKHIKTLSKQHKLKVKILDAATFPCGTVYFEKKKRMFYFDNPSTTEVLVHNNWIVSKAAKVYRFKEMMLWMTDTSGYYSNPERRYLSYSNPYDFGKKTTQAVETEALKTAFIIGHLLNRTVILPSFTCHGCTYGACHAPFEKCNLLAHYSIASLDAILENQYREHVFLDHPLVPSLLGAESETYFIKAANISPNTTQRDFVFGEQVVSLSPKDPNKGPTQDEIIGWFSENLEPVLRFHSLYNLLNSLSKVEFSKQVQKAINEKVNYRQFPLK